VPWHDQLLDEMYYEMNDHSQLIRVDKISVKYDRGLMTALDLCRGIDPPMMWDAIMVGGLPTVITRGLRYRPPYEMHRLNCMSPTTCFRRND
jgi:hypothetical protein